MGRLAAPAGRDDREGKLWADLALGDLKDMKIAARSDIAYDAKGDHATIDSVWRLWRKRPGRQDRVRTAVSGAGLRRNGAPRHYFAERPR